MVQIEIICQRILCSKILNCEDFFNVIFSSLGHIRCHSLNHCQFQSILHWIDLEYNNVLQGDTMNCNFLKCLLKRREGIFLISSFTQILFLVLLTVTSYCKLNPTIFSKSVIFFFNFTERLIWNHSKFSHPTPEIYKLQWLLIAFRVK